MRFMRGLRFSACVAVCSWACTWRATCSQVSSLSPGTYDTNARPKKFFVVVDSKTCRRSTGTSMRSARCRSRRGISARMAHMTAPMTSEVRLTPYERAREST